LNCANAQKLNKLQAKRAAKIMRTIFSIVAAVLLTAPLAQAQTAQTFDEQTVLAVQTYANVAEVKCMVALTPAQEQAYTGCCAALYRAMYKAVFEKKDALATIEVYLLGARNGMTNLLFCLCLK
jgi:hypothetical protein